MDDARDDDDVHDTIAALTAHRMTQVLERTEGACVRVAAALGDGWRDRARVVWVPWRSGSREVHRIEIDGACAWRLWWEQSGERSWTLRDEWMRQPEAVR